MTVSAPTTRSSSGKWAIVVMLALAVAATGIGLGYNYYVGHKAVDFWGTEAALLIDHAPQVSIHCLCDTDVKFPVRGRPGLPNLRRALVLSPAYNWNATPSEEPNWEYAIIFRDEPAELELRYAPTPGWIATLEGKPVLLQPEIARELTSFFKQQLATGSQSPPQQ